MKVCFVPCRHGTCNRVTIFMSRPALQRRTNPTRAYVRRDSTMTGLSVEEASSYNHRRMQPERVTIRTVPKNRNLPWLFKAKRSRLSTHFQQYRSANRIATIFVCMVGKGHSICKGQNTVPPLAQMCRETLDNAWGSRQMNVLKKYHVQGVKSSLYIHRSSLQGQTIHLIKFWNILLTA